jgi:methionine-rich copper-binding protein CopC
MIKIRLAITVIGFTLFLLSGAAFAHGEKEANLPADGAVLQTSPEKISMTFEMPMRITFISLRDNAGREHDLTRTDNMQLVTEFDAVPAALPLGRYTIEWRGLAEDGHSMEGDFSFEIEG